MSVAQQHRSQPSSRVESKPPRLLVSVRNAAEAQTAIAGGADVLDVKEPTAGSLGRASLESMHEVAAAVRKTPSIPCSVALGELRDVLNSRDEVIVPIGVRWVKMGLSGCADLPDWQRRWLAVRARIITDAEWIAVAYVDADIAQAPPIQDVLAAAISTGCAGLLLDTFSKTSGTLLDCVPIEQLDSITRRAQAAGLMVALAGRVQRNDLPALIDLQPDLIAVRSAVCRNHNRIAAIDAQFVAEFRQSMHNPSIAAR